MLAKRFQIRQALGVLVFWPQDWMQDPSFCARFSEIGLVLARFACLVQLIVGLPSIVDQVAQLDVAPAHDKRGGDEQKTLKTCGLGKR